MTVYPTSLRQALLTWYDTHARTLPWRTLPQERAQGLINDPYKVWLSEIMLQQTTIASVKPYFERFVIAFPTVEALASAPIEAVLGLWAGLGYYARGRNLHTCAKAIVGAGGFPRTPATLAELPGIGPYTSAAIASIAFDYPAVPVDGNVERVLSRLLRIEEALPAAKPVFRAAASQFESEDRAGDFAQALMDLGSTVCTPRKPKCETCPWQTACRSFGMTDIETLPRKTPKKVKPKRYGIAFFHLNENGVLVATRADKGLLGGMLEVPGTAWRDEVWALREAMAFAPIAVEQWTSATPVRHVFTHFDLTLDIVAARGDGRDNAQRVALGDLGKAALPSVMLKVIRSGLDALGVSDL
jgi:A/G-specific adenine glycosylase